MSANLYWKPIRHTRGKDINVSAPSNMIESLSELTGEPGPWFLDGSHLPAIRALYSATKDPGYQNLIDAIERTEGIEINAEY